MWNTRGERQKSRLVFLGIILIFLLGIILYSGILHAPFVLDDYFSIIENDTIKAPYEALKGITQNRYLAVLSFAFNYWLGSLNPFGYHLINNLIHSFNALLVCYFVILTFKTPYFGSQQSALHQFADSPIHPFTHSPLFIAFSSALIFVSHPIQTQAVTYVAQRITSMATMFYLISLVMYIKWRLITAQQRNSAAVQQIGKKNYGAIALLLYCASVLSAILAMKTKEIAFTLPVVITLYEFSFFNKSPNSRLSQHTGGFAEENESPKENERRTPNVRRFLYLLPIFFTLLIIPLSMISLNAPVETIIQDINIRSKDLDNIPRTDYLLTQFRVIMTYLRLLVIPINQSLDYDYPFYRSFFDANVFLSFIFLLLIFAVAICLFYASRKTHFALRLIAFGIFWFFITLSVESSLIPIRHVIAEHRLYLPSIGFFIAAVLSVNHFFTNMRLKTALMAAIVLALSIGTYNRNTIWKDPQTLWEDVLAKSPNNARAYNNLGVELKNKGEFDKAIEQFEKSLKADKNYTAVYFNLGYVHYRIGNYENSVAYLSQALTGDLTLQLHLGILNKLGMAYSAMGRTEDAINAFKEAIKISPLSVAPYNNLGIQYIKAGRFDLAIDILEKAVKIRDEPYLRSNLSTAYDMREKTDKKTKNKPDIL